MSLVEAVTNVVVGFAVALLTQIIVFPLFDLEVTLGEKLAIGSLFTLASICRSFALRRLFESHPRPRLQAGSRKPIVTRSATKCSALSARTTLPSQRAQFSAILTMKSAASLCSMKLKARSRSTSSAAVVAA
jgi:hypothetical protein